MRVAVNARTLSATTLRGWSRYTANLFREMSHLDVDIFLLSDRDLNLDWVQGFEPARLNVAVEKGINYLDWEQRVLPSLCRRIGVDILHCPVHYGLPMFSPCKTVLTLHDAIEVAYFDKKLKWWELLAPRRLYARGLNHLARKSADHIITVSKYSQADILEHYQVPESQVSVVYEGADPAFALENTLPRKDIDNKFDLKQPYFFYLGGLEGRKNIGFLIQCFSKMRSKDFDLVIAGGSAEDILRFQAVSRQLGCAKRVHFLGPVEEWFLPSLYFHAKSFVYPSEYEGFGLQLVEAMTMECPILSSNQTSLPEIFNFPQGWFHPTDSDGLIEKLNQSAENEEFLEDQKLYLKKRKADFQWSLAAKETIDIYNKILQS